MCVNENGEVCDVAVKKCRLARYEDIGSVEDFENAVDELRKRQWISVNDRLPENGKEVLCWYEYFRYGDYNHLFQTYGIGYQFNGHWSGEVAQGSQTRVIAWQPLPEPPKED